VARDSLAKVEFRTSISTSGWCLIQFFFNQKSCFSEGFSSLYHLEKELIDSKYPFLAEHLKRVQALPELQSYLKSREWTGI
jgi:hypothetical protein